MTRVERAHGFDDAGEGGIFLFDEIVGEAVGLVRREPRRRMRVEDPPRELRRAIRRDAEVQRRAPVHADRAGYGLGKRYRRVVEIGRAHV